MTAVLSSVTEGICTIVLNRPEAMNTFNVELAVSFVLSIVLSALILYYIDQPDIQLQMQS